MSHMNSSTDRTDVMASPALVTAVIADGLEPTPANSGGDDGSSFPLGPREVPRAKS